MIKKKKSASIKTPLSTWAIVASLVGLFAVVSPAAFGADAMSEPVQTQVALQQKTQGVQPLLRDLQARFPQYDQQQVVLVDATRQELLLIEQGRVTRQWTISTAEAGIGSQSGSNKTPLGVHRVAKKYGDGEPLGMILKARQVTGRLAPILTAPGARSQDDNVTTRILWLDGLEPGLNKGGNVDSFKRYIYIHGTDEEGRIGQPASHGCVRMKNRDVVELFDRVGVDTLVVIAQQKQNP